jgi:hypothetical protein
MVNAYNSFFRRDASGNRRLNRIPKGKRGEFVIVSNAFNVAADHARKTLGDWADAVAVLEAAIETAEPHDGFTQDSLF